LLSESFITSFVMARRGEKSAIESAGHGLALPVLLLLRLPGLVECAGDGFALLLPGLPFLPQGLGGFLPLGGDAALDQAGPVGVLPAALCAAGGNVALAHGLQFHAVTQAGFLLVLGLPLLPGGKVAVLLHPVVLESFSESLPLLLLPVPAFFGEAGQTPANAVLFLREFPRGLHLAPVDGLDAGRMLLDRVGAVGGEGVDFALPLPP
jgi:hypothetical protein